MNGFGNNSRRGVVPAEVARKIARQRNELAEEVERLRRKNEELAGAQERADDEVEALEARVEELERELAELRGERSRAEEHRAGGGRAEVEESEQGDESGDDKPERVKQLERRVASLKTDLDRVRDRADTSADRARREERMRLLSELGGLIDSLERGLSMVDDEEERAGLEGIYAQLRKFLRSEGATLTGTPGQRLDPHLHEAIGVAEDSTYDSGEIADVARPGIALDDGTVVLPARVRVAA